MLALLFEASKILKREGTPKIVTDEKNNWQLASAGTLMVGAAMVMVRGKSVALRSLEFMIGTINWNAFGQVACSVKQ